MDERVQSRTRELLIVSIYCLQLGPPLPFIDNASMHDEPSYFQSERSTW